MRRKENFGKKEQIVAKVIPRKKKELERNGAPYRRLSEHIGLLPVVMIAPDDTTKFAEKVAQLLSHPEHCRELGRQGFDYATANWTAKSQAQRLETFYQNRIANKSVDKK